MVGTRRRPGHAAAVARLRGGRDVEQPGQHLRRLGAGDRLLAVDHEHRHAAHPQALGPLVRQDDLLRLLLRAQERVDGRPLEAGLSRQARAGSRGGRCRDLPGTGRGTARGSAPRRGLAARRRGSGAARGSCWACASCARRRTRCHRLARFRRSADRPGARPRRHRTWRADRRPGPCLRAAGVGFRRNGHQRRRTGQSGRIARARSSRTRPM